MDNYLQGIVKEIKQHKTDHKKYRKTIIKNKRYMSRTFR